MYDPTEEQFDKDVHSSMNLFESAHVGTTNPVAPLRPNKVLVALDGSDQDDACLTLAFEIQEHFECEIGMVDSREHPEDQILHIESDVSGVKSLTRPEGEPWEIILTSAERFKADMIIVSCPHGRNLEAIGPDSTGTVIDVLLARAKVPILAVRAPIKKADHTLREVHLRLFADNRAAPEAAAWAVGLAVPGGKLSMVLVVEQEYYEKVNDLLKKVDAGVDLSAEKISEALTTTYSHLHAELQKAAKTQGFQYTLRVEKESNPAADDTAERPLRIFRVLALDRGDQLAIGHITERIRFSQDPLLIVPAT